LDRLLQEGMTSTSSPGDTGIVIDGAQL